MKEHALRELSSLLYLHLRLLAEPTVDQGNPEFLVPGIQEMMGSSGIDY
jgi:hypothetical protein